MHEFFIVQNLLKTVEDYVAQYNAKKVSKLVLLIGKFSGVEPDLLQSALEFFKKGTVLEDAEIVIEIEELKNGNEVRFGDFKFVVVQRKERKGRNPKTGEEIVIPARKAVKVRVSSKVREAVNQ